jgi:trk system potassium uptake protein TrkA
MLKICVIGVGVVGSYLAKNLSNEGYEVAVIDKDKEKINEISKTIDVVAYNCNAFNEDCISLVKDYDLFIVATNSDKTNLAITLILRAVLGKKKILVRVNDDTLSKPEIEKFLGIEIFNAFSEVLKVINNIIKYPFISSLYELEDGDLILFTYKVNKKDKLFNKKLVQFKEIREKLPFTIALIEREGEKLIPTGNTVLKEGDVVYILIEKDNLNKFIKEFNLPNRETKNIFILGYSKLTLKILEELTKQKKLKIKFFDGDLSKCELVAEKYPNVLVLNSKLTDEEFLKSENIGNADLVISSSSSEEGILACILAKQLGAKKVIAMLEQPELEKLVYSLGIDVPIVSRKLLARKVYKKIKHRGFLDTFELSDDINIFEIYVNESLAGKKVYEISKKNFVILSIERDGKLMIVHGNTVLKKNDILIVLQKDDG